MADVRVELLDEARALLAEAIEYTDHQSWRCDHPPHWYLVDSSVIPEGDCPCGLHSLDNRIANFLDAEAHNGGKPRRSNPGAK
jgi:hypothetical protein